MSSRQSPRPRTWLAFLGGYTHYSFSSCREAMPSKKVMKVAMKNPASKKKQMKKPSSKKDEMKKPATSAFASGEKRTKGRSEFLSTVYRNSREAPIGGLIPEVCEAAHVGVPASEALRETWKSAIEKTYTEKVAEDWTSEDCIQGSPSCLHVQKPLHTFYDDNNMKEDDKTSMVAFLPAKMQAMCAVLAAGG